MDKKLLEDTLNRAEKLSQALQQPHINLAAFMHALLADTYVANYIKSATQYTLRDIQNAVLPFVAAEQKSIKEPYSEMPLEENVGRILATLSNLYREQEGLNEELSGLYALYFVLSNEAGLRNEMETAIVDVLAEHGVDEVGLAAHTNTLKPFSGASQNVTPSGHKLITDQTSNKKDRKPILAKDSNTALAKYTACLNDQAHEGQLPPMIGRQKEVNQTISILRRKTKSNPLLLGEPGVGKSAIAEGLAQMAEAGQLPEDLSDLKIFSLDLGALIEGTTYRGDFEARIKNVINEIKDIPGSLLFIDEIHMLLGAGRAGGSVMDAANLLKPALARAEIRCMGATTLEEHRKYFAKDAALDRRFNPIDVNEPSPEEALKILQGIKTHFEFHHDCAFPDEALQAAVQLSDRYMTDRFLPDKAIDVIDEAGSLLRDIPWNLQTVDDNGVGVVTPEIIAKAIAAKTGLPLERISTSDRKKILSLQDNLDSVVHDQAEAVAALANSVKIARTGLREENKPIASVLFDGPTGVGKTELARQLAENLGVELIKLDMSEYMERHTVSRLIGAPPGYVGYDKDGALTGPVRKGKYAVVLLDEIEKAHPDIYNILLQVMDDGVLTDATGKKVDFRHTVLIMTSNASAGGKKTMSMGFGKQEVRDTKDGEVERIFSPEFRNRLDAVIRFNNLSPQTMISITSDMVSTFVEDQQKGDYKLSVSFTQGAIEWLAKAGHDPDMGARPLKRLFEQQVKLPLADAILAREEDEIIGETVIVRQRQNMEGLSLLFGDSVANDKEEDLTVRQSVVEQTDEHGLDGIAREL